MWSFRYGTAVLAAMLFCLPFIHTKVTISVPPCISKCIDQSTDDSCEVTDVKCICRESNGRFLPDVVLCMHGACANTLDVSALLTPLSLACQLVGTPISPSALGNAQIQASQITQMATITVTQTGNVAPIPANTQLPSGHVIVTVTQPLVVSTVTQVAPGSTAYTGFVPVVVVGTVTDSAGSATTVTSTFTQASGGTAGGIDGYSLTATTQSGSTFGTPSSSVSGGTSGSSSLTTRSTTASQSPTKSSTNPNAANTDSSPFGVTGSADRKHAGSLLGLVFIFMITFI